MRKFGLLFAIVFATGSLGCGKGRLKEFAPTDGKFTVLMHGTPTRQEKEINGLRMTGYYTGSRGEEDWVIFTDAPAANPAVLDDVVRKMSEAGGGTGLKSSGNTVNGDGYREFEFLSTKYDKYVSGRAVLARHRLYLVYMMGKNAQLSSPDVRALIDSFQLTDGPTPGRAGTREPDSKETPSSPNRPSSSGRTGSSSSTPGSAPIVLEPMPLGPDGSSEPGSTSPSPSGSSTGSPSASRPDGKPGTPSRRPPAADASKMVGWGAHEEPDFRDSTPEEGYLVGFDVGYGYATNSNNDIVIAARPIFRVGEKNKFGELHGTDIRRSVREFAKPGYAVGALTAHAGLELDGFYLTYMKVVGDQLDPNDAYNSPWLGGPRGMPQPKLGGDGRLVVGVIGKTDKDLKAIGLQLAPASTESLPLSSKINPPPVPPKIPKCPRMVGSFGDPEFREEAPSGELLIGFYLAPGGGANGNGISSLQPIYLGQGKDGKDKELYGSARGTPKKTNVKLLAKPGYAVGAVTIKNAIWLDGLSITFMKIDGDRLDPTDSYESPWNGNSGGETFTLTGNGLPVVGIIGRQGRNVTALGLLFKTQEPAK